MGIKITFNTFTSLANETSFISQLNTNFTDLEAQIDLLLSRDGEAPNTLIANLDVNSQKLINLIDGTDATDAVNVRQLQGLAIGDILYLRKLVTLIGFCKLTVRWSRGDRSLPRFRRLT